MTKKTYPIVGMKHHVGAVEAVASAKAGDPVDLVREKGNVHDANAVQVWMGNAMVGYVPKTANTNLAARMDAAGRTEWSGIFVPGSTPVVQIDDGAEKEIG
jgi:hypothetical protein